MPAPLRSVSQSDLPETTPTCHGSQLMFVENLLIIGHIPDAQRELPVTAAGLFSVPTYRYFGSTIRAIGRSKPVSLGVKTIS